jgi:hypothetical protein
LSPAIAEKSLVNDVADSEGAAAADELLDVAAGAALLDVAAGAAALLLLELELPQAASTRLLPTASTATIALPFRKCIKAFLLLASGRRRRLGVTAQ